MHRAVGVLLASLVAGGCGSDQAELDPCAHTLCAASDVTLLEAAAPAGTSTTPVPSASTAADGAPTPGPDGARNPSLANLDFNFFQCQVEPILDRNCSMLGCHGDPSQRKLVVYSRGRLRNVAESSTACPGGATPLASGTVACNGNAPHTTAEWNANFDSARALYAKNVELSELVRQPTEGGDPHVGVHPLKKGDDNYQTILSWLSGSTLASCDPTPN